MTTPSSVTTWLGRLHSGDLAAAQPLWHRYYSDLVRQANQHLPIHARRAVDGEDLAAAAFADFCDGAAIGRFPNLHNRDDLWRLLLTITLRRVSDRVRHETRDKRDSRKTIGADDLFDLPDADLDRLTGNSPDPAVVAEIVDLLAYLLKILPDDLRSVAKDHLDGYTAIEIVQRQGGSLRSVRRCLQRSREYWRQAEF